MAKIAEAYIHLQIDPSEEFLRFSEEYLFKHAKIYTGKSFQGQPEVYIRVSDGSYKAWITVASAIYIVISGYGSFRSGIDHLVNDARKFSEYVTSDFIKESKVPEEKIFRLERRLGVPGKIQRILKRIDNLASVSQTIQIGDGKPGLILSQRVTTGLYEDETENIKSEIFSIFELLESKKDREVFIKSIPKDFKDEMPDDFAETLLRLPRKDIYRKEDEPLLEMPVVKKLPPAD